MRAALTAVALALSWPATAGTPLALAERQVVTLEYDRAVARLAVTDPELLSLEAKGARVRVVALRAGRATLEVAFADGVTVAYDVSVEPARRPPAAAAPEPGQVELRPGEERRLSAPGAARILLEENGVARVQIEGEILRILGLSPGAASLVVVDERGERTTYTVRVR